MKESNPALSPPLDVNLRQLKTAITVADVAALLNVSQRHVYKLVQNGEIPHFKIGGAVRFDPDLVATWLSQQMAKHPGGATAHKKKSDGKVGG